MSGQGAHGFLRPQVPTGSTSSVSSEMRLGDWVREAAASVTARLTLVGRGSQRRRGPACSKGAAGPDLSVDLAGRGAVGGAVPRVRIAGRGGAARVLHRPARCDRGACRAARDFPRLLRIGQVDILLAPTLSMIPLGGFLDSGGVGLWGILAPLGALVFSDVRSAIRWYLAFLVVFLGSGSRARSSARSGRRCPAGSRARCWPSTSRSAAASCSHCSRCSPASAAMRSQRSGRNGQGRKAAAQHPARARSPTG